MIQIHQRGRHAKPFETMNSVDVQEMAKHHLRWNSVGVNTTGNEKRLKLWIMVLDLGTEKRFSDRFTA